VGLRDYFLGRTGRWSGLGVIDDGTPYSSAGDDSHLAEVALTDFLGWLPDYVAVTESNAMKVGTVAAGVATIAGTVSRLSLYAEQGGTRVPQAQQPALLGQLERGVPMSTSLYWTARSLVFRPCTWWLVTERDYYGWPMWGEWLKRSRVRLDAKGRVTHVDNEPVAPEDVIRFDSPLGDGLLANGGRDIRRAIALDLAAAKAEDSPIPAVELHNESGEELDAEKREKLLEAWAQARAKRGVAYTPKNIKVIPHGKPADALLIDGRRAISLDLVRHLHLPAWAASTAVEGATMTYDNRQLRNWELIDLTLSPYFKAITDRLSLGDVTPRGWRVKFDTDELTQPDLKTRFEAYEIGKRAGFIDNEWIAGQEGWATVPADKSQQPEEAA